LVSVPVKNFPAQVGPEPVAAEEEPLMEATLVFHPSAAAIAACRANPEAMAALDAGDPERFARAMGLDAPSDAYLAAAGAEGSVFDRRVVGGRPPRVVLVPPKT
jgi:DNA-binding FadR family transcriptional regulator